MSTEKMSFLKRMRDFFGMKSGQTLTDFQAELKALTSKDKEDLVNYFNQAGMPTEMPANK